ncbi:hypothetical protein LHK_01312 [Laribacter hongkongensis HLHK9]|uniref:Uncharacterized protein n=2 Tax=Laribacter hongkongensis TaxID=168471 RepID=C1D762_LARHH|nr:hypothetical protein LHK_01312 [Laribacter hongkongensis HLHK9]ASJ24415.1 hypothetical protein LHGZ1_1584 [Laribacter hongkongensis]
MVTVLTVHVSDVFACTQAWPVKPIEAGSRPDWSCLPSVF